MTQASENRAAAGDDGFSAHVADEVAKIRFADLSANVVERARQAVLDWLGVTIAGAAEPSARILQEVIKVDGGNPTCAVLGTSVRAPASQAALANAVAGHALDFDDLGLGGHPSVPIASAVFALAEELGSGGPDTVAALVAGYQAMALISFASGTSSYARGFHTTGTVGVFGVAAACGHLLGLSRAQLLHAIGLAATQGAGLKASFGTMGKHLNAGKAASNGLLAARLASAGFSGPIDAIESRQGFAACHNDATDRLDSSSASAKMGHRLGVEFIYFKVHASCGATHSAIASVQSLLADRPFSVSDIHQVRLIVPGALLDICGISEPATGLEAKFSIRYVAARALAGMDTGPAGFTDAAVNDPSLAAVQDRIEVVPVTGMALSAATTVAIRLQNGEELRQSVNTNIPTPNSGLAAQRESLSSKFRNIVEPVLGTRAAGELLEKASRLDSLSSVSELLNAARSRSDVT